MTMRLRLGLSWAPGSRIPVHYHAMVQGAIYQTLEPSLAAFIHDHGIPYQARQFRLFTFSRILGQYQLSADRQWIQFPETSELVISSPLDSLLQSLARRLLDRPRLHIASSSAEVVEIHAERSLAIETSQITFETLSPIVVYNTTLKEGRKYTQYRAPNEPEFAQLVESNLAHKAAALAQWGGGQRKEGDSPSFAIRVHQSRLHVLKYRDIIIKGYSGVYTVTGQPSLLRLGLEAGLGSKNAQGFGCVAAVKDPRPKEANEHATGHAHTGAKLS